VHIVRSATGYPTSPPRLADVHDVHNMKQGALSTVTSSISLSFTILILLLKQRSKIVGFYKFCVSSVAPSFDAYANLQ
jgi:hypothetical protein